MGEIVKRKVIEKVIINVDPLISKLKEVWSSPEIVAKATRCIECMPQQVSAVIQAKVQVTKY